MVGEEDMLTCGNFVAQGSVVEDELMMGRWEFG